MQFKLFTKKAPEQVPGATSLVFDVRALADAEREMLLRRRELRAQAVTLEAAAGDSALELALAGGDSDTSQLEQATKLRMAVDVLDRAVLSVREQRRTAIRQSWQAEVDQKFAGVAAIRAEAADLKRRVKLILAQAEELEGCEFVPYAPRPIQSSDGRVASDPVPFRMSRSAHLESQAAVLENEIRPLTLRDIQESGEATGRDAAELLAVIFANPYRLGPLDDIFEWAAGVEARERARRLRIPTTSGDWLDPYGPLSFKLAWSKGHIVTGATVVNPAPATFDGDIPAHLRDRGLLASNTSGWHRDVGE